MKLPSPENETDASFLDQINELGWGIVSVPKTVKRPEYAFSVGLYYKFKHPELIVTGLPLDIAEEILDTASEMIAGGEKFTHLSTSAELLEDFLCGFRTVEVQLYKDYLGYAQWFYGDLSDPFPCLQLLWPDKKGKLPGDKNADSKLLQHQPILFTLEN